MKTLEGRDIIMISAINWNGIWARPQHLAKGLSQNNRILYIEPPSTVLSPLRDRAALAKWTRFRRGPVLAKDNIWVFTPPVILPFANRLRAINKINCRYTARFIKGALRQLNFRNPLLFTYLPGSVDILGRFGEDGVCYDCVDEHAFFTGVSPKTVWNMEKELIAKSDLVLVSAQRLYRDRKHLNNNIHLVPNACEYPHFSRETGSTPKELAGLNRPILGFMGGIYDWIDLELIRDVALMRPEWNLVLIGPVGTDVSLLSALDNVYLIGSVDYTRLPDYVNQFTVGIIPFKLNELTKSVNPVKLYEYLAAGLPVVSTNLREVRGFTGTGCVFTADSKEEFVYAIEQAIVNKDALNERCRKLGQANSWKSRVELVSSLLHALRERI